MHSLEHGVWGVTKHVAVGYLLYSLSQHYRGRVPNGHTASAVVVGAMFPDLVDKPLAVVGVLEYGRAVAHSLLATVTVIAAMHWLTRRLGVSRIGTAFGVGYLSHLAVDLYGPLFTGITSVDTAFLFWPVLVDFSLGVPTPSLPFGKSEFFTVVIVVAFYRWVYDRLPVVAGIARFATSRLRAGVDR